MCNRYRSKLAIDALLGRFGQQGLDLNLPEGAPNLGEADVSITDTAPIVRLGVDGAELVARQWSWPGLGGKPVYNFRSEGRRFASGRCLVPTAGFYEYTAPPPPAPKSARKLRWLFTPADGDDSLCIAGIWRTGGWGEAWTMLTVEPGPDVAPYHSRQVVVVPPAAWRGWLEGAAEPEVLRPSPAGTLTVARA